MTSKVTILVVEDNEVNYELISDVLTMAGYNVLWSTSAEEGIQTARDQKPQLVLMDVGLPGMDGLAATEVLKNDPSTRHIPVVCVTSHAMKGDRDRAEAVGSDGYITKPIDTRLLADQLAAYLGDRHD